jgi:16S rRNA pseudouridine516 synthase
VKKRYIATLDREPEDSIVSAFASGIVLGDGTVCKSGHAEPLGGSRVAVEISVGKYHQVKRMLASRGAPVVYLKRLQIGALKLDPALAPGQWREMTDEEAAWLEQEAED